MYFFNKNIKLDEKFNIYGIVNVPEKNYKKGLREFTTSNYCQIKKILAENEEPIYIAVSVNPAINIQKDGKVKEIVQLTGYKILNNTNESKNTTGYCTAICEPIIDFEDAAQNRVFFEIRPHGQFLIKKIYPEQSNKIIEYIKDNLS